jgi:hypothetical protein
LVTLILRPPGRGAWTPVVLTVENSRHAPLPLEVFVGQRWTLGGKVFRISEVRP